MKAEKVKGQKRLKRLNSTSVTLWKWFTLFAVIMVALMTLICSLLLSISFSNQSKNRVETIGKELTISMNAPHTSQGEIETRVLSYVQSEVDVFIVGKDGTLLFPQNVRVSDYWEDIVGEATGKVENGDWKQGSYASYTASAEGSRATAYVACVLYGGQACYLLVWYPLTTMAGVVSQMQVYMLIVAAVAILISFFVSYSIAESFARPLRDMSQTAKRLAGGDYSVQFVSAENAEIAGLSDTLNYMKDEMKKSDEFQKELLANVSHDLRTPLTMIKAYASMIQEISGDDPEKRNKHLQVIIDETDRLTGLVNDILSSSKISSGLEQLNKKVFNITEFLYSVINKFGYLQETQGYNFMIDIDPNLYTVADEEKIGQVFYNLISNAVNYTGEDKTIFVSLKYIPETNRIKFAVRDTGKGIAQDELKHIWDRYYRSKDTHSRPVKGTGLGLNIVKVILLAHSFDFGVTSEEGKGSTFYVDFPEVSSKPEETPEK